MLIPKNRTVVGLEAEVDRYEEEIARHEERIEQLERKIERCENHIDTIQDKCEHVSVVDDGEWVCERCGMYVADLCASTTAPDQKCVVVEQDVTINGVAGKKLVCQFCGKEMQSDEEEEDDEEE
jgi:ribosomal protein L37AE/L43A